MKVDDDVISLCLVLHLSNDVEVWHWVEVALVSGFMYSLETISYIS